MDLRIPEMIQKVVSSFPEWVAALIRNQWQLYSGMGGRFEPESTCNQLQPKETISAIYVVRIVMLFVFTSFTSCRRSEKAL